MNEPKGKGPIRDEVHPPLRGEPSSVELANKRAAEIMEANPNFGEDEVSQFDLDPGIQPDGWAYGWKKRTVAGYEDPSYQISLQRGGWTAVPAGRHPNLVPSTGVHHIIERDGLVLMERPKVVEERARMLERRKAMDQVQGKERQLREAPQGQFDRNAPIVKKHYAAMEIPKDGA